MQQKSWCLDYCYFIFNLVAVWDWNRIQTYPERNINFTLYLSLSLFFFFFYRFACFCEFWESERMSRCQVWLLFRLQVREATLFPNVRFPIMHSTHKLSIRYRLSYEVTQTMPFLFFRTLQQTFQINVLSCGFCANETMSSSKLEKSTRRADLCQAAQDRRSKSLCSLAHHQNISH